MARAGLSRAAVVSAAAALADEVGLEEVTLSALADRLGIRTPSLYNHVDGLAGLRRQMTLEALVELDEVIRGAVAGRSGTDAVAELCRSYRAWARRRPGLYQAVVPTTEIADAEVRAAGSGVLDLVVGVVSGLGLEREDALHATRAIRAAVHGFASLESAGGFGLDVSVDESFDRMVALLVGGLEAGAAARRPAARAR